MTRLWQIWLEVRASLWFFPALGVVFATALAIGLVSLDATFDQESLREWEMLFGAGSPGARELLSTVASSMITVAGVVFSITIVALAQTSNQYTSRVLRNFTSDRANQAVLAVFVSIFVYCLVVLRTVREQETAGEFVPSVAVLVGLVSALVGIGVLIFFIHHIATSIQAGQILANVAAETLLAVDRVFPDRLEGEDEEDETPDGEWLELRAARTGYLQSIDLKGLTAWAAERDAEVRVEREVGQFVISDLPLLRLRGTDVPEGKQRKELLGFLAVARQRTVEDDPAFGLRQVVDVALKALSPGVNDTTTASMALDRLTALLERIGKRRIAFRHCDEAGRMRVRTCGPSYEKLVGLAFDQIRQNADGNVAILGGLLQAVETLNGRTESTGRRDVLATQARVIADVGRRTIASDHDRERFERLARRVLESGGGD